MYRASGVLLSLILCLAATAQAQAHFLFIALVENPKGNRVAEVYFSDNAEAGDSKFVDKIAGTKLWLQNQPGQFQPIKTRKLKDRLAATVPDKGSFAVVGSCEYGVLPRKPPFLLRHFPKAVAGTPEQWHQFKPFSIVPLEILTKVEDGKLRLTVLRKGQPMPHAEINTLAKDLSGTKLKCDATGSLTWQPPQAGWYMVYTSDFKKEAGTHQGKDYQEIRDFASLSFQWQKVSTKASSVSAETVQKKAKLEIIDTHTHFYDPTRPQGVPWPAKNDKLLYRTVMPGEYKKLAKPFGVVGALVVEASPWVEDNQWILDLAAKDPFLVGVIGNLDPMSDDFENNLTRFAKNPLFRGIRILHKDVTEGLKGKLVARCQLLIDHNLALDVNGGPDMPADVALLAAKLPKLRIIINHAANLKIDGKVPPAKWREGMKAAAKYPNVYCKVSALVEQTGHKPAPANVDYYRPVLDTLWNLFGEDRLIFGSNWPVSENGAPYETVVGIVREYFTAKGDQAAAKFFLENSQTAYGWKKR